MFVVENNLWENAEIFYVLEIYRFASLLLYVCDGDVADSLRGNGYRFGGLSH